MQPRDGFMHYLPFTLGRGALGRLNTSLLTRVCVVAAKFSCNPRYDVSPGLDF